jgi:hypothetical protein
VDALQVVFVAIGGMLGGGGGVTIISAVLSRKLRSPADDQSRIEFGVKVLQDRLNEANADRQVMQETSKWMRAELDKRDQDKASDFAEKTKLYETIRSLESRIDDKDRIIREQSERLERLAGKVAMGQSITVEDIFGVDGIDIEDTLTRADLDRV